MDMKSIVRSSVGEPEDIPSFLLPKGTDAPPDIFSLQRNGSRSADDIMAWAWRARRWLRPDDIILDIGCGIGMMARALHHVMDGRVDFILMDRTGNEPHVPVSECGYAHNDLDVTRYWTRDLNAMVVDADTWDWSGPRPTVVMSTLSWGFHYPIELYLDRVLAMEPRAILMDLRETTKIPGLEIVDKWWLWGKARTMVYEVRT